MPKVKKMEEIEILENSDETKSTAIKNVKVSKCSKLRLRQKPNTESKVLKELLEGEILTVDLEFENDEWYKVKDVSGKSGYVMKDYTE